jgi:hypothetical protein
VLSAKSKDHTHGGVARARIWALGLVGAGLLVLAGCATPSGSPAPSDSASPTASATVEPTPTPQATETAPAPSPTETSTAETPYNGEVLIVTTEVVGSRLEVTAMIPDVEESGGTCRLEVIGQPVTATVSGNAGNDVTYCGVMSVTPQPAESWEFRVTYRSASTSAQSALSSVESAG